MRQPPENQEGAGEVTGYLCPRGRRHDEYKRLLSCPGERLQLLMCFMKDTRDFSFIMSHSTLATLPKNFNEERLEVTLSKKKNKLKVNGKN